MGGRFQILPRSRLEGFVRTSAFRPQTSNRSSGIVEPELGLLPIFAANSMMTKPIFDRPAAFPKECLGQHGGCYTKGPFPLEF